MAMENRDHDILIELRTKMDDMRSSVENLLRAQGNFATKEDLKEHLKQSADHETRLRLLEKGITQVMTWGAAALVAMGVAQFLISKYY